MNDRLNARGELKKLTWLKKNGPFYFNMEKKSIRKIKTSSFLGNFFKGDNLFSPICYQGNKQI